MKQPGNNETIREYGPPPSYHVYDYYAGSDVAFLLFTSCIPFVLIADLLDTQPPGHGVITVVEA